MNKDYLISPISNEYQQRLDEMEHRIFNSKSVQDAISSSLKISRLALSLYSEEISNGAGVLRNKTIRAAMISLKSQMSSVLEANRPLNTDQMHNVQNSLLYYLKQSNQFRNPFLDSFDFQRKSINRPFRTSDSEFAILDNTLNSEFIDERNIDKKTQYSGDESISKNNSVEKIYRSEVKRVFEEISPVVEKIRHEVDVPFSKKYQNQLNVAKEVAFILSSIKPGDVVISPDSTINDRLFSLLLLIALIIINQKSNDYLNK